MPKREQTRCLPSTEEGGRQSQVHIHPHSSRRRRLHRRRPSCATGHTYSPSLFLLSSGLAAGAHLAARFVGASDALLPRRWCIERLVPRARVPFLIQPPHLTPLAATSGSLTTVAVLACGLPHVTRGLYAGSDWSCFSLSDQLSLFGVRLFSAGQCVSSKWEWSVSVPRAFGCCGLPRMVVAKRTQGELLLSRHPWGPAPALRASVAGPEGAEMTLRFSPQCSLLSESKSSRFEIPSPPAVSLPRMIVDYWLYLVRRRLLASKAN